MDIKNICKECEVGVKDKSNYCPHCGKPLEIIEATYIVNVKIRFLERPKSCSDCRFGINGYAGSCLLDLDVKFSHYPIEKYYGKWGNKMPKCPIDQK